MAGKSKAASKGLPDAEDTPEQDGPDRLDQDEKEKIQHEVDQAVLDGDDPLLPEGSMRDRKTRGGQRHPRPPSIEESMVLSADEIKLIEAYRAKRKRFTPELIKIEWEKRRQMEMTTSGNILPPEPPEEWLPNL